MQRSTELEGRNSVRIQVKVSNSWTVRYRNVRRAVSEYRARTVNSQTVMYRIRRQEAESKHRPRSQQVDKNPEMGQRQGESYMGRQTQQVGSQVNPSDRCMYRFSFIGMHWIFLTCIFHFGCGTLCVKLLAPHLAVPQFQVYQLPKAPRSAHHMHTLPFILALTSLLFTISARRPPEVENVQEEGPTTSLHTFRCM